MSQKHSEEYKIIGQAIKRYRKQRGLTQEQLADKVSISISYLTKIEYYGAAEPPVRCGESHLSGLTEPLRSP